MSPKQAEAERDRLWLQQHPDGESGGQRIRFRDLWPLYQANCIPAMKVSSRDTCSSLVNKHLIPIVGDHTLLQIDAERIQRLVWQLHDLKLARGSIQVTLRYLRVIIAYGREKRRFAAREWPARGWIKLPPKEVRAPERCFSPEESRQILDACDLRLRCLFGIVAVLGVRCNEVLGLAWPNIDFAARVIRIRQGVVKRQIQTVKSETSNRDLPITDDLYEQLLAWRDVAPANPRQLLFVNDDGLPMTNREAIAALAPILKRLSIPHGGIHAFRHGVATETSRTASIKTVQGAFGHAKVETTLRYAHDISRDRVDMYQAQSSKVFGKTKRDELGHGPS